MQSSLSLAATALVLLSLAGAGQARAATAGLVPPEAKLLAAHRAVYDVELDSATSASGVAAVTGRIVFEFTGSVCEGFTQNFRFVMDMVNREGASSVSDVRTSTWEEPDGHRFRFTGSDYQNEQQGGSVAGSAERDGSKVTVQLDKPESTSLALDGAPLFPVQHTVALLAAAIRGEHMFMVNLYDGSDKGTKVYLTNSVIGAVKAGAPQPEPVKNSERLDGIRSWPVSIAYYDEAGGPGDGTPQQQMSFRFFENGVIQGLKIDYGSFAVRGHLAEIEFYEQSKCDK